MDKNNILFWSPRIIIIILICIVVLFSLDVFEMEGSFSEKIGGFLMHNIPAILLGLLLIFSWKKEKAGGIAFIILGTIFTVFFKTYEAIGIFLLISLPPIVSGFLFLLHDQKIKKASNSLN